MSELPVGWVVTRISDLCNLVNGRAFKPADWGNLGLPIIRIQNLNRPDAAFNHFDGSVAEKFLVRKGDLLFAWSGTPGTSFGAHIWDGSDAILNQHIFNVRYNREAVDKTFFRYAINQTLEEQIAKAHGGVGLRHVTKGKFEATNIALPPIPEQRRIVAKIDRSFVKSNRARAQLDHIPRLVEKYKHAILAAAFRGELTREYRTSHIISLDDSYRIRERVLAERDDMRNKAGLRAKGRNRSLPTKVIGLPELPSVWGWLTFDDCAFELTVGHVGPMKNRYVEKGIPFLRSLNVRANRVDLTNVVFIDEQFNRELAKSQLKPGDLVIVRTGEPGVAAVVPSDLKLANCSDLVICRLVQSMNPTYAAFYMNSEFAKSNVRNFQVGVAQQHFNVGAMSEMPVPYTSLGEQNEIVRRIKVAFDWIDRLALETKCARRLIDHLDQAILAKAFRGELAPQDPNDEPASVLLGRIREEREVKSPTERRPVKKKERLAPEMPSGTS